MITKASRKISQWLLSSGAIAEEDMELYEYLVFRVLFNMIPVVLVIIIGAIFHRLSEALLMITPFILIRKFSGGLHLKSSAVCFVSSTLLIVAAIFGIQYVINLNSVLPFSGLVLAGAVQVFCLSPIDSESRKLTSKERNVFRKAARILLVIFTAVYFVLIYCGLKRFAIPVGMGILITALLQLPCLFVKEKDQEKT